MRILWRFTRFFVPTAAALYLVLLLPDKESPAPPSPVNSSFSWNRDEQWNKLEQFFTAYRTLPPRTLDSITAREAANAERLLGEIEQANAGINHPLWDSLLTAYFNLAPLVAVNRSRYEWYTGLMTRARQVARLSISGNLDNTAETRARLYTILYGMRTAQEEVALQLPAGSVPNLLPGAAEPSVTGSAELFGIRVHSGDILLSRGGADVSAFIARGNDFPGNFSHIALLYVGDKGPLVIEAHIEKGVAVSTVSDYIKDRKRRFMVMRLRNDHPRMKQDPMLPHKAAAYLFNQQQARHIPYDFSLNYQDHDKMFCSEVASAAYESVGVPTWTSLSTVSAPGLRSWLYAFGVREFNTQMPSDLEYDPQFSVIAEWRDMETLFLDHIDNAVMDAWYEQADRGMMIGYNRWKLPLARIIKGYCMILNKFGKAGLIPEGMTATQALRNERFSAMHSKVKADVIRQAAAFRSANGYRPPYWQLLSMARKSVSDN